MWFLTHGIRILAIVVLLVILLRVGSSVIDTIIRGSIRSTKGMSKDAERKREDTLIRVFTTAMHAATIVLAAIMVLSELGIDTGPLIAGAGVVGVAVGFGGQYLIKDVISGFFIILENQFRVGDVVCLDNTCGLVEDITLRLTILRDLDGTVHHVPNGEIKRVSNMAKEFSRVNIDIGIGYNTQLDHIIDVVNTVGAELAKDKKYKDKIKTPPAFERVESFDDSAIRIKILGDVEPLTQWEVAGELRKRLKIAFDQEGIEIPFPQRVIHTASARRSR